MNEGLGRPRWQGRLAALVLAFVLFASPPLWASIALTSAAIGVMLYVPLAIGRRQRLAQETEVGGAAVVLGCEVKGGAPVVLTDRQLQAHAVIMGASGSGKSTTLLKILTDQIARGTGVVALDMKGSPTFALELARAAKAAGREFGVWTPDGPSVWNPLAHGNPAELKDKLISMERFTEIHYQRAAERYLQLVLQLLKTPGLLGRAPTLHDVVGLMDPTRLEGVLRAAPADFAAQMHEYLGELTPDQLSGIRGLGTRLAIIDESHTGRYLGGPASVFNDLGEASAPPAGIVDLRAALRGEQVVLFSLNASSYGKLSAQLAALVVHDLISAAGERLNQPGLRHPALVAIDEVSALEDDHILGLNARCREAGVGSLSATQEPTDFERAARGLLNQVLGSTAVKILHRLDVPSSAETMAKLAGTETAWEYSRQLERHPLFGTRTTGRSVGRQVERLVVHPNVIKSLPTGQAVVITKVPETRVRLVQVNAGARPLPPPRPPARVSGRSCCIGDAQTHSSQPRRLAAPRRDGPELG